MIERELLRANRQEVQREMTQLALIREARAAQRPPLEPTIVGERSKRHSGLFSPGALLRATRALVAQPS